MRSGNSDLKEIIEAINARHAAVMVGGKFRILTETPAYNGRMRVTFAPASDLRSFYENEPAFDTKKNKAVNPIKLWMAHEDRRQYQGVVFEPGKDTPGFYNYWQGFQVQPAKGSVKPWTDHVKSVICNGDKELSVWVLDFIAEIFQNIGDGLQGSALVTRGTKGTGKGVLVEPLAAILGDHFVQVTGENDFLGAFNSSTAQAVIIYANEAFWAGRKAAEGALKARITENTVMINEKYVPAFTISNHAHIIFASNEDWVVPATWDERRYCVTTVSDHRRGDTAYFNRLFKWCDDPRNQSALLYFFQNRKITSNLRQPPVTAALVDQIEQSAESPEKFWLDCLDRGRVVMGEDNNPDGFGGWVRSEAVHVAYIKFCREINEKYPSALPVLTQKLKEICPDIELSRKYFNGAQARAVLLPALDIAKDAYNRRVGRTRFKVEKVPF